jgi:hypothetical protein
MYTLMNFIYLILFSSAYSDLVKYVASEPQEHNALHQHIIPHWYINMESGKSLILTCILHIYSIISYLSPNLYVSTSERDERTLPAH